jgi:hypothetical protein
MTIGIKHNNFLSEVMQIEKVLTDHRIERNVRLETAAKFLKDMISKEAHIKMCSIKLN